jgi:ribA/ribD-fused uncharacterized protein
MSEIKFWKGGNITSMTGNNIFVYGANPEFRNGFGAAKTARQFGAKPYGSGRGIVGNTFGLITKNLKAGYVEKATGIKYDLEGERSVSPEMISANIDELYQCALDNPDKKFFVAYMNNSRNLNGYSPKEMWDMFTDNKYVPENIRFHESFRVFLKQTNNLTQAGQKKREGMSKLKEAYDTAKESGNVRTATINPNDNSVESKPTHNGLDYNEAIKVDNQPRENFTFFWHSPSPFSQWHPSIFKVKDITFTSGEQFMMYCKAKLFKDEAVAQEILDINMSEHIFYDKKGIETHREDTVVKKYVTGQITKQEILSNHNLRKEWEGFQKQVKNLGRKVRNYDDSIWIKHRVSYVAKGNFEKFSQNEDIKQELLNTGNTIMAESNYFDKIWAIGIKESDPNAVSPSKWKGLNLLGKILTNLREKFKLDLKNELELNQENITPSEETQQRTRRKNRP